MPSPTYRQQKVGRNFEDAVRRSPMRGTAIAKKLGVHQSNLTYWYKRGVTHHYAKQAADLLFVDVKTIKNIHKRTIRKNAVTNGRIDLTIGKNTADAVTINKNAVTIDNTTQMVNQQSLFPTPPPRTVNVELLQLVANMRLSVRQEATLLSLALTFLGEES